MFALKILIKNRLCSGGCLLALAGFLCLSAPVWAQTQVFEEAKLWASDSDEYDCFGSSVSASGNAVLIGASDADHNNIPSGAAYLFRLDQKSQSWVEDAKLFPSDGEVGDSFGSSLILSGDQALIGAPDAGDAGAAYLFNYDSGTQTWLEDSKLTPSSSNPNAYFSQSLALGNGLALIGAFSDDELGQYAGAAYIFRYDPGSDTWNEEAKLTASDGGGYHNFGHSVALHDDMALIGAYGDVENGHYSGAVYVFRYDPGTQVWNEEAKLQPSDPQNDHLFGNSLAVSGPVALISALGDGDNGYFAGAVYLFRYDAGTGSWNEETKLTASDGGEGDFFGTSLALWENKALISICPDKSENQGAAYLFTNDSATGFWSEKVKFLASDGVEYDGFGYTVGLTGTTAFVGADYAEGFGGETGAAYVFDTYFPFSLDIQCNGQDQNVLVSNGDPVTLTIEAEPNDDEGLSMDVWVIVYSATSTRVFSYGYLGAPCWCFGISNVYYSGEMINLTETVLDKQIRPGIYTALLLTDSNPDKRFHLDDLYKLDSVQFMVLP